MATKTIHRRTARKARSGTAAREKQRGKSLRKRSAIPAAAPAPAIIADSIYKLRLKPVSGAVVFFHKNHLADDGNGEGLSLQMLHADLWEVYKNMAYHLRGEEIKINMVDAGLEVAMVLTHVLRNVRAMIPKGLEFNIEFGEGCNFQGHYLVAYKECDYKLQYNQFPVGAALLKLEKENPRLLDLFICFLKSFCQSTGVDLWWQGYTGNDFDYAEERLDEMALSDEGDVARFKSELEVYSKGEASRFQKILTKAQADTAEGLQKRLNRFHKTNAITKIISQGIELMTAYHLKKYEYEPNGHDDNSMQLDLDGQWSVLWDDNDYYAGIHEESLDSIAQEGIQTPVAWMPIYKDSVVFPFEQFEKAVAWPTQLQDFMICAYSLIKLYV